MSNLITGSGNRPPEPPRLTVKESDLESVVCDCGSEFFIPVIKIKKVSRLLTGSATDSYQPIETIVCLKCQTEKLHNEASKG